MVNSSSALAFALFIVTVPLARLSAQDTSVNDKAPDPLNGSWTGILDTGVGKLRLILDFKRGDAWKAELDIPDQGAKDLPADSVVYEDGSVVVQWKRIGATYRGRLEAGAERKSDKLTGVLVQGREFPLDFVRSEVFVGARRPQTPKPPFPYRVIELRYSHAPTEDTAKTFRLEEAAAPEGDARANETAKERVCLAGTLTLPRGDGPFPAVLLVSGSGPQDRDETIFDHKLFHVLADALTRRGIAVLRYDDRGIGASTGSFATATTRDFAKDAHAGLLCLAQRADIDHKRLGIIGHSEGGIVGPMVAVTTDLVHFIVALGGTAVPGADVLQHQMRLIGRAQGMNEDKLEAGLRENRNLLDMVLEKVLDEAREEGEQTELRQRVVKRLGDYYDEHPDERAGVSKQAFVQQRAATLLSPWFRFFLAHDPRGDLRNLRCAFLGVFGEKDLQVDPAQNLDEMKAALAKNERATFKVFPQLNHFFQTADKGTPDEYRAIEETIAPAALTYIVDWVVETCRS